MAANPTPQTRFEYAVRGNKVELVRKLLADPRVDPSANNQRPLYSAILEGHTEVAKLLLHDPRVDPSADNQDAIRQASKYGLLEIVKLLLADPRVDPSAENQEAIRWASAWGKNEVVKLLLADTRVDPSAENQEAIREACGRGHTEVVKLLLSDPRVDPSAEDQEAIRFAIENGNTTVLKLLLADPRVNPEITAQTAQILRTSKTLDLDTIVREWAPNLPQILSSVNLALEKEVVRHTAKNLVRIQTLEKHTKMIPNIANTISLFAGTSNRRKTITNRLSNLKGNYYGPKRPRRKTSRIVRQRISKELL